MITDTWIKDIAKVCHEANRALCQAFGDNSQQSWEQSPEWQQHSAIDGVNAILHKQVNGPADSHNSWMAQKIEEGWRLGAKKDVEKKLHPCLVSFDRLFPEQQAKDYVFFAVASCLISQRHNTPRNEL